MQLKFHYWQVYRMKGDEVPVFARQSKGLPIINLLAIEKDEKIKAMLKVSNADAAKYLPFTPTPPLFCILYVSLLTLFI